MIEMFYKVLFVYDDVEDGDDYCYGDEVLYKKYGIVMVINVGDYFVGLGY